MGRNLTTEGSLLPKGELGAIGAEKVILKEKSLKNSEKDSFFIPKNQFYEDYVRRAQKKGKTIVEETGHSSGRLNSASSRERHSGGMGNYES